MHGCEAGRRVRQNSSSESLSSSSFRFCRLYGSISWRRAGLKRLEKTSRDGCDFIHRRQEASFVGLRRLVDSTDFSHELERRRPNLFRGDRRLKVEECFNVSAHGLGPCIAKFRHYNPTLQMVTQIGCRNRTAVGRRALRIPISQVHSDRRA